MNDGGKELAALALTVREPGAADRLAAAAKADLDALSHPDRSWVPDRIGPDGSVVDDVIVVGGGQSGVIIAAALRREGVKRVSVLDQAPAGREGPWLTFARMAELRTPKELVGSELGIPNLSLRSWFCATYGAEAWDRIERVPRQAWKAYLDWYARVVDVSIENFSPVNDVRDGSDGLVTVDTVRGGQPSSRYARAVVLATGYDGAGGWQVPDFVSSSLPDDRYHHSCQAIDFDSLAGRRVGVLGHGAAAFDNAIAALRAGAHSVEVCFRRPRLPRTNPHRFLETAGVMSHYPELSDETRWRIARYFRENDQPPPIRSFTEAMALSGFVLRPGTPWLDVSLDGIGSPTSDSPANDSPASDSPEIVVDTPGGTLRFDHLILATGSTVDLAARPELRTLAPIVERWSDRYQPPPGMEDERLAALPYLGNGYQFRPRSVVGQPEAADRDWVGRVFAFNFASGISHGPHSTSISGHKHALPRLVQGVTRRLLLDLEPDLVDDLLNYRSADLPVADDFEEQLPGTMNDVTAHDVSMNDAPMNDRTERELAEHELAEHDLAGSEYEGTPR